METSLFIVSTSYYDNRYRVIQSRRSIYDGGVSSSTETVTNRYDFTGRVLQSRLSQYVNSITTTVDNFFSYDHAGRAIRQEQLISGDTQNGRVTLTESTYDEAARLTDKKLHGSSQGFLQSVDYTYNIRGWLTGINNPDNLSTIQPGDLNADLYAQRLQYQSLEPGLTSTGQLQFNGNISAMVWNTQSKSKQGYGFTYDALSRLKESDHKDYATSAWTDNSNFEEKSITYDLNGNINTLVRTGGTGNTLANYTYTYSGTNRIRYITTNGVTQGQTYVYDVNGNTTTDGIRGVTIGYNYLNLPLSFTKGTETIAYIYSAQGEKLAKRMKDGMYQYYAGNMVYKNDKSLNYLLTPEGMVTKTSSVYTYEYHLKDHLGNTRVAFQPNGTGTTLTQATEYYPFGMNYPQSPGGTNKYLSIRKIKFIEEKIKVKPSIKKNS